MDFMEVAAIVDRYRCTDLNREVDPHDEMYNSGKLSSTARHSALTPLPATTRAKPSPTPP